VDATASHLITAAAGLEGHGSGLMRFAPALLIVTADSASATSFAVCYLHLHLPFLQ